MLGVEAASDLNHQHCRTWTGWSSRPDSHEQSQEKPMNHTHRSNLRELREEFSYIRGIPVNQIDKPIFPLFCVSSSNNHFL